MDGILARMIFDGEHLSDLLAPLDLGWKARTQAELALMADLLLMNVLTSRQREIVRIMPATRLKCLESMGRFEVEMQRNLKGELELVREPNPTAGRLGLTTTVAQFVEGQILRAMEILSTDPIELSVADFESARSQLLAYTAVQKSARISLGFAPETPAQAAPEQEPAHTMAP